MDAKLKIDDLKARYMAAQTGCRTRDGFWFNSSGEQGEEMVWRGFLFYQYFLQSQ